MEEYKCPISKKIFRYPVTMDDGYTYEYLEIFKHLLQNDTSPVTNFKNF